MLEDGFCYIDVYNLIDIMRHESSMSIELLCENIIDPTTFWRYLNNIRKPSLEITLKLIQKLGIKLSDFFIRLENSLLNLNST